MFCKENKSSVSALSPFDTVGVDSDETYPDDQDSLINSSESLDQNPQETQLSVGTSSNTTVVSNIPPYYE